MYEACSSQSNVLLAMKSSQAIKCISVNEFPFSRHESFTTDAGPQTAV
jgi:hypothetical protein